MSFDLRPYQQRVIAALWAWFRAHKSGNPVVSACVASGKSVMIAAACKEAMQSWPGSRMVVITHQKELLQQNADKMRAIWPGAPIGIWSAAIGQKTIGDVTFATIGSIYRDAHLLGRIALIHIDECHLVNPKEMGMMRAFIEDVRRFGNPDVRVVGWTGTPFRGNGVWLTAHETSVFTHIIAGAEMKEMLELGFLAPLIPAVAPQLIDTQGVRVVGDDFDLGELAAIVDRPDIVDAACQSIAQIARREGRGRWVVFAVNVSHAGHIAEGLRRWGVRAAVVTGETPQAQRDQMIVEFRRGILECLVNVGVLTTGFDVPEIDFIALLRPTRSPVLYVQMMGRGMRISASKVNCLVADYTDTAVRMGPVDAVKGRRARKSKKTDAPFKICENCGARNEIKAKECLECGLPFEVVVADPHGDKPSGAAMLSSQLVAKSMLGFSEVAVTRVTYTLYAKEGKVPSVMVCYFGGIQRIATEWVHFGQPMGSPPRRNAEHWWRQRTGIMDVPGNADGAVQHLRHMQKTGSLLEPKALTLDDNGKYPAIVRQHFGDDLGQGRIEAGQVQFAGRNLGTPA